MSWHRLTTTGNVKTLIDFSKVSQAVEHREGTQLIFETSVGNKENKVVARTSVVIEPLDAIAKLLKVR